MLKYEDLEVIELDDITDIADIMINSFVETNVSMCLISDRSLVEYTMVEMLKHDDITADEIFLFDSDEFPMYVGIDKNLQIYVDDTEEKGHLNYDIAFIDMDGSVDQSIIDECLNKCSGVILFGEVDDSLEESYFEENEEPIRGININFEDGNKKYDFKFYSLDKINVDSIIDILKELDF